jgi:hypothetical protein
MDSNDLNNSHKVKTFENSTSIMDYEGMFFLFINT